MGIAGSVVDSAFWERYLGMRVEAIDMTEFVGRMSKGTYDQAEFGKALAWVKENCPEGDDYNSDATKRAREQLDSEWEDSVKMALIARDLMVGNPNLAEAAYGEQAQGHHAIAAGFQGQRQWTDHFPNGDFMEAILNTSFDWNGKRPPYIVATENDALNGPACSLVNSSPTAHKFLPICALTGARMRSHASLTATNWTAQPKMAYSTSSIPDPPHSMARATKRIPTAIRQ